MRNDRALLFAVALAAFAPRAAVALLDLRSAIGADLVQDDAFYYFTIARNAVEGHGLSFDGLRPTNAFHPLFMAVAVAAVALFGGDLEAPIRAANLVLAGFGAASAALLYAIARRATERRDVALGVALLFAASPYFVVHTTNALETGLALCATLAAVHAYQRSFGGAALPSARASAGFGALAGLALLARIDAALVLAALGIDALWTHRVALRSGSDEARHRFTARAALAILAAALVWLPWGALSRATTGEWLPSSGSASREIALHLGWSNLDPVFGPAAPGERFFERGPSAGVPPAWWADVGTKLVAVQTLEQPLLGPLRVALPYRVWPQLRRVLPYRIGTAGSGARRATVGIVLAAAGAGLWLARRRIASALELPLARITVATLVLTALGYTFYSPTHWYLARYSVPSAALAMLAGTIGLAHALPRKRFVWAIALLVAVQLWLGAGFAQTIGSKPERPAGFLAAWEALSPSLPDGAHVGAFQSGVYGWFGDRPIVNLDGKVNSDAQRALRAAHLHRFVADSELDYLLDWESMLRALLLRHRHADAEATPLRFREVARERPRGGVVLWRIERDREP